MQVKQLQNTDTVFEKIIGIIVRLAEHGLIHCDFNEFNIMVCASSFHFNIPSFIALYVVSAIKVHSLETSSFFEHNQHYHPFFILFQIDDDEQITVIDFPQMVSVSHRNAEMYELELIRSAMVDYDLFYVN